MERGLNMPITEAQKKATTKYVKNNYDRHVLTMPKGKKASLQAHAADNSESLNSFVNRAVDEAVERDKAKGGSA
jgi:predicted HicB family RNase H-like nuclease